MTRKTETITIDTDDQQETKATAQVETSTPSTENDIKQLISTIKEQEKEIKRLNESIDFYKSEIEESKVGILADRTRKDTLAIICDQIDAMCLNLPDSFTLMLFMNAMHREETHPHGVKKSELSFKAVQLVYAALKENAKHVTYSAFIDSCYTRILLEFAEQRHKMGKTDFKNFEKEFENVMGKPVSEFSE